MKLIGTGSALPKKVVTNAMLSEFLDTSDEWIVPRTGIHTRHVISDEELKDFIHIQQELERISITVETLQLWSEQMLATGKINMEQYNALTGK